MKPISELLKLYFVMGSQNCKDDPRDVLRGALEGGVTLFQFREKGEGSLKGDEKLQLAKDLQRICKEYQVPFIVNDDIDLAIELDADGVHIGQEDEAIEVVREKVGNKQLGVSAHNIKEAEIAIQKGADYIGVGPMYQTSTKPDAKEVQGPNGIELMRSAGITIPIVGIGGINELNAKDVIHAGADGIAVVTAISHADSPREASIQLLEKMSKTSN